MRSRCLQFLIKAFCQFSLLLCRYYMIAFFIIAFFIAFFRRRPVIRFQGIKISGELFFGLVAYSDQFFQTLYRKRFRVERDKHTLRQFFIRNSFLEFSAQSFVPLVFVFYLEVA